MPRVLTRMGVDVERALTDVDVPAYVIDRDGILIWLNPAAEKIVGDVRGQRFTDAVAPEDRARAKEVFTRKIIGTEKVTNAEVDLLTPDGGCAQVEISSTPLLQGHRVIGVFGLVSRPPIESDTDPFHPLLTPRQRQILRMLANGMSTQQIAEELHITRETVRNHVRAILRALDAHSRLEAIAMARTEGLLAS